MGIATGLTAARMQEIIDRQIVSGAVDLSGNLVMTREDGSSFDAGVVKGAKGDPAIYALPGFPSGASDVYVRLGILDGLNDTNGAGMQFHLSGLGHYGLAKRGTVLVHVAQRGANAIDLKAWSWGVSELDSNAIRLYTRATGTYLFEVWAKFMGYTASPTLNDLSRWRATLALDGNTSVAPSNLVNWTIERADYGPPPPVTPAGTIQMFGAAAAPSGYLACEGQSVSRATYAALFAAIGTQYGSVDGASFTIPNLKGRTIVGLDTAQTEFNTMGKIGGAKTHTLTEAEMPSHQHDFNGHTITWGQGNIGFTTQPQAYSGAPSGNGLGTYENMNDWADTLHTGGGGAHNNLQPYAAMQYIIKT